jgi:hypothetical protein
MATLKNRSCLLLLALALGTNSPPGLFAQDFTQNVTITTGNRPSVSLIQDGSGGHSPQSWEFFGNQVGIGYYDITGDKTPFFVWWDAPNHGLVVANNGTGFGIPGILPDTNLHVHSADLFTTLRLETSNPSTQAWDLSGGVSGFDLIDHTNGDAIPFGVASGAPTNSLFVSGIGHVGLGTASPSTQFHVQKAAQPGVAESIARFDIADDNIGKLEINNVSAGNGIFHPRLRGTTASQAVALTMEGLITSDIGGNPVVAYDAARRGGGAVVNRPLVVFRNNTVVKARVAANGDMFATSFQASSSRELKDRIVDLDSQKASEALRQLNPVEFVYKDDATGEGRVGFIAEDVPEIVANIDRKSVPVMDVVALVTRVVKDQQQTIHEQQKTIEQQQKIVAKQQEMLESLSRRLGEIEKAR